MTKLEQAARQAFETWWEREGQEFLFALNTTTDDDIKLVAEVAWKNGAYCAKQAEQEPVGNISLWHNHGYQNHNVEYYGTLPDGLHQLYTAPPKAEQEPVACPNNCDISNGYCVDCPDVAPPQREWVSLTDDEREEATGWSVEHIESYLKEKNK